jgi:hypothetical protein
MAYNGSHISEGKAFKNKKLILKINIIMETKMSNYRNCFALAYMLLVAVLFVSCTQPNVNKTGTNVILMNGGDDVKVIEIDSCEYLYYSGESRMGLAHKGNCKYCLARNTK